VGLTNVLVKDDPNYFNVIVNGAKVYKGDAIDSYGRPTMLVPRTLNKEMMLTLTWVGKEFQLNFMAETFIDNDEGLQKGENCVLSFANPKCLGMEHLASRETTILGETIKMNSNLFYDADKQLIKDKKVMVYVMDTSNNQKKEISASNA
jgi:hypothetical protein